MKLPLKLLLLLALVIPACSAVEGIFTQAADPEIAALSQELVVASEELQAQYGEILVLQDELSESGITVENTEKVLASLAVATTRYETISATVADVRVKIDEKESEEGVPWYVTVAALLAALAVPTMNTIPIIGPIMSSLVSEKMLERIGVRSELDRAKQRIGDTVPPHTP